ncbi:glycosyltransferase family 4 protein [Clostridium tertium]|uniref:glycosyltransferase family 4 protein n=1 Tax=Clostridium tertium TaxID=1559 RepID=UPI002330E996|nr:glycosyltransferase family 4 protein [Clostridium tertium]MDB1921710.1 glycosyltransferase family 4 protein [Clostridium tertium]MDB1924913.1 glycosyltransferase family 4 protein [Clostridium tertium]MDB1929552.1 glycosyltransferase family 4 protein [Clostridium tertium]
MRKDIYFQTPRRKWENDIVNNEYNNFEFLPKYKILFDGEIEQGQVKLTDNIKEKLKKNFIIKNLLNTKWKVKLYFNKYIPKYELENMDNYHGAVISQVFLKEKGRKKIPYITYIENSHSILGFNYENYEDNRKRKRMNKHITELIKDEYFKGFVFYSKRSKDGFYKYFKDIIPEDYKFIDIVYPMIKNNSELTIKKIEKKIEESRNIFKLIFVSSIFSLKGGIEIIEAYKVLKERINIEITFITNEKTIPKEYLDYINNDNNLKIIRNNLNNRQLIEQFNNSHVLLHPTFMDSTAIVVMEALNSALPVIATDTFAIPEYIEHGINGFIMENPIKYWDDNYIPLKPNEVFGSVNTVEYITKIKETTIHQEVKNKLIEYITMCYENYETLSKSAFNKVSDYNFNEIVTREKWEQIINSYIVK